MLMCLRRPRLSPESLKILRAKHTRYNVTGYDVATDTHTLEKFVDEKSIEQEIQAKGLSAPRLTLKDIERVIVAEAYITGDAIPVWCANEGLPNGHIPQSMECLTVCVLVLKNGFTVTGESACVSRENFNSELGRKAARQKAVDKIWALEGYLLKQELFDEAYPIQSRKKGDPCAQAR
jgi:hypothetical protein